MDLLGSIMGSMDKPPSTTTEAQRKQMQDRKMQMQKWKLAEDKRIYELKKSSRAQIEKFFKDSSAKNYKFEPMNSIDRAILREIADEAGLVSFSFGQEEVDRHVIVWKKEFAPSDDELAVLRKGEIWTQEKAEEIKKKREEMQAEKSQKHTKPNKTSVPKPTYQSKYNHILKSEVGKDAAATIVTNKQFGNVKLENKQDRRTIEQTLADRRVKKQKLEQTDNPDQGQGSSCS